MKSAKLASGAFLACTMASAAYANSGFASAEISNLSFSVIDLAPTDGVLPEYKFFGGRTYINGQEESGFLTPLSLEDADRTANVSSTGLSARTALQGEQYSSYVSASTFSDEHLWLSPQTALIVTADVSVNARSDCLDIATDCNARAYLMMDLYVYSNYVNNPFPYDHSYFSKIFEINSGEQSYSNKIYLTYANLGDADQPITLNMSTSANISSYKLPSSQLIVAAAVPEPASILMLCAGLVAAWAASARKR